MTDIIENFKKTGALYVKHVISTELTQFLTHVLLRQYHEMHIQNMPTGDAQVQDAQAIMGSNIMFDTVAERIWPFLENILGEELIPTYSYARLYTNGNVLKPHTDRPSCEISLSIQLGRSHHYSWPLHAGNQRFDLAEGDALLYKGCEITHWRDVCKGPDNYYSGQLFCHYVRAAGPWARYAGDQRWSAEMPFKRFRTRDMEIK
jgi:hypothetical protein